MARSHIWQGVIEGGWLDGRQVALTERDGSDVFVVSHYELGRRAGGTTTIVRGEDALAGHLAELGRVVWRRLWRSRAAA